MTIEFDETFLEHHLDGIKKIADKNDSKYNEYPKMYNDYIRAYSILGLYITTVNGKHVVKRMSDL